MNGGGYPAAGAFPYASKKRSQATPRYPDVGKNTLLSEIQTEYSFPFTTSVP
jgi:hypothetical protein